MLTLRESKQGVMFCQNGKEAELVEYWPRLLNLSNPSKDGNETLELLIEFLLQTNLEFAVQSIEGETFLYCGYGDEGVDIFLDRFGKVRIDLKEILRTPIDFLSERKQKESWLFKLVRGDFGEVWPELIELEVHTLTEFTFYQHFLVE